MAGVGPTWVRVGFWLGSRVDAGGGLTLTTAGGGAMGPFVSVASAIIDIGDCFCLLCWRECFRRLASFESFAGG